MRTDARVEQFLGSLDGNAPPAGLSPALAGCFYALRGEWDRAHEAVQGGSCAEAWVHAALHREEGDLANAGYWYRRAQRPMAEGPVRDEYLAIVRDLLAGHSG